nr:MULTISPECIES: glycosyltransferase family 39 protein [Myxococcaceae]
MGPAYDRGAWAARWRALSAPARVAWATGLFAALLFVPYLGAVGLWDPWETHYGEVARQMVHRGDYLYPWYETSWFFSKPPLTMWMQALGMQVVGTLRTEGALGLYTEWGMRLPFALLSIAAVSLLSYALARLVSARAGLAAGFVLSTMPLWFLLTRQAVTDLPFVATLVCAMACALVGQLDETTRHRSGWWYAFYVFCGLSTLAKGLLGVGLPAIILLVYAALAVIPWSGESLQAHLRWLLERGYRAEVKCGQRPMPVLWEQLSRMRLGPGVLVFLGVAGPWYLALTLFDGVDDEGKVFWYRFFIHDHLNRLTAGVHTTTPGGSFTYFIEQGGYAIFPWVAALPGALALAGRVRLRGGTRADHVALIAAVWAGFTFFLMTSSATKFHHYVFPLVPALALLIALFVDRLWEEGIGPHGLSVLLGLVLFCVVGKDLAENPKHFTDLFVYNYDRPYPVELDTRAITLLSARPLWLGDPVSAGALLLGAWLTLEAFRKGSRPRPGLRALGLAVLLTGAALLAAVVGRGQVSALALVGVALLAAGAYLALQALRAPEEARTARWLGAVLLAGVGAPLLARGLFAPSALDPLTRALSQPLNVEGVLGLAFLAAGLFAAVGAARRSRMGVFGPAWLLAAGFALWFNWNHWVDLSHHWTQRDLFWRYYRLRQPEEPIAAYMMNWHGETFYSRNTVLQFRDAQANQHMREFADQPGREWALVEHNRLNLLRSAVGPGHVVTTVDPAINNKFVLVSID